MCDRSWVVAGLVAGGSADMAWVPAKRVGQIVGGRLRPASAERCAEQSGLSGRALRVVAIRYGVVLHANALYAEPSFGPKPWSVLRHWCACPCSFALVNAPPSIG